MSRKILAPLVTVLLVVGVAAAIYMSASEQINLAAQETVRGVSGSEKLPFFRDEQTINALAKAPHNVTADVENAGSRQIATSYDLQSYDFAFPAGVPAAEKIKREQQVKKSYQPFFTPMVIASWKPVAEVLMANNIVERREGAYYIINMQKLMQLIISKVRWRDLKDGNKYPANKSVLVTTTDIRKSNSAAMYLALASYVLNGETVVQNQAQVETLIEPLTSLFMRQGFTESSSAVPFQDYLTMGPGKSPMVMIYEAQFLHEAAKKDSAISEDMVLLYPEPTIFTKHVLIPFSDGGVKLGEALSTDENLQKIATQHGLRTDKVALFREFVKENNLVIPSSLVNVIEPPGYEILESMIQQIEARYMASGSN